MLTLDERRERGNLITVYELRNQMERVDNEDFILTREGKSRQMRGYNWNLRKDRCLSDVKKCSFPQGSVGTWNELEEGVVANEINETQIGLI